MLAFFCIAKSFVCSGTLSAEVTEVRVCGGLDGIYVPGNSLIRCDLFQKVVESNLQRF